MNDKLPDVRRDTKHYNRHLVAFYVGITPVLVALLYAGLYVESFIWFVAVALAGFFATVVITISILPYPICGSCGRTVRKRPLDLHVETEGTSYCCTTYNIRWTVEELDKPCR